MAKRPRLFEEGSTFEGRRGNPLSDARAAALAAMDQTAVLVGRTEGLLALQASVTSVLPSNLHGQFVDMEAMAESAIAQLKLFCHALSAAKSLSEINQNISLGGAGAAGNQTASDHIRDTVCGASATARFSAPAISVSGWRKDGKYADPLLVERLQHLKSAHAVQPLMASAPTQSVYAVTRTDSHGCVSSSSATSLQQHVMRGASASHLRRPACHLDAPWKWKKYGQKTINDGLCIRNYFRCRFATSHGCRARKQEDTDATGVLHVNYTGAHTCEGIAVVNESGRGPKAGGTMGVSFRQNVVEVGARLGLNNGRSSHGASALEHSLSLAEEPSMSEIESILDSHAQPKSGTVAKEDDSCLSEVWQLLEVDDMDEMFDPLQVQQQKMMLEEMLSLSSDSTPGDEI
eukprot:TRINITY_DN584_c0_g1_i1.p1 TRINITY_DN584_c0_g1~~TRINITY_DN584_c0_g1_i1.p1  ORF type:complete len:404 (-),score=84.13 TRINITY_DN584_c0_g1_i1:200-1411(-)